MSDPLLRLAVEPPRPRRRARGVVLGLLVLAAVAIGELVLVDDTLQELRPVETVADRPLAPAPAAGGTAVAEELPLAAAETRTTTGAVTRSAQRLGVADGVELLVPGVDPVVVSYHEASRTGVVDIDPAGELVRNENATRAFDAVGGEGPAFLVQVSRGRRPGPTTAVDVVLRDGDEVLAPVTGTVVEVRPYLLYGAHEDVRIELVPDGHPDVRVVLIHVEGVSVATGDRVTAGEVIADGARGFPFEAVVDRATAPERHGHVHLEVKRVDPVTADVEQADGQG